MSPQPDVAGFRDAQRRLADAFDEEVEFLLPSAAEYAPGTAVDPEDGRAFDPWAPGQPGEHQTVVTARVSVVNRPSATTDDTKATPLGVIPADTIVLLVYPEVHEQVKEATAFRTEGNEWKVTDRRAHTTFGLLKWLYYGKRK